MQIETLYKKLELDSRVPCTDSRNVPKGSVFFALKGESFDGNLFAQQSLDQGAAFAVVDDVSLSENDQCVVVSNVLETFQELAAYHRSRFTIPVLVVGGSNGKTTTKELIRVVLETTYRTLSTSGNLNNHIGVPATLFRITTETEIAVIEIGANHAREHELLCRLVAPTHVLVTNNGKDHLEGFGSLEGVRVANREIYDYIRELGGHAFVIDTHTDLVLDSEGISRTLYDVTIEPGFFATVSFHNEKIQSQLVGTFNGENIAGALTVGMFFDVPLLDMKAAIASYVPAMLRSQVIHHGDATWILDCYNANPSSMELGLQAFSESTRDKKVVILGDMFELGDHSLVEHQTMVDYVLSLGFEKVFFIGKAFSQVRKDVQNTCFFESSQEAKNFIASQNWSGYSVFVKGSRGMKLETLLPFEVAHS